MAHPGIHISSVHVERWVPLLTCCHTEEQSILLQQCSIAPSGSRVLQEREGLPVSLTHCLCGAREMGKQSHMAVSAGEDDENSMGGKSEAGLVSAYSQIGQLPGPRAFARDHCC